MARAVTFDLQNPDATPAVSQPVRAVASQELRAACEHKNLPVKFDSEKARGMDSYWVREQYPRFSGNCPDCGERMIGYASFEHYVAGDW